MNLFAYFMGRVFELIQSNKVYSGELSVNVNKFRVNGRIMKKELVEYSNSVGILPVDNQENLLFIQQYRFAAKKTITEIPAGKIEKGESPEQAALRELNEEIGYSGTLTPIIQWYLAPGYSTEKMHLFLATGLKRIKKRLRMDDDEIIKTERMNLHTAIERCLHGDIEDCKTVSAIMLYARLYHH
jgi:ADP-ribose pyrophosphatase